LELGRTVAALGGALVPAARLDQVALDAAPQPVELAEIELRFRIARTREPPEAEPRRLVVFGAEGGNPALELVVAVEGCRRCGDQRQCQTRRDGEPA